jgi:AhpC/TSA antioxidant enzyme
LRDRYQEFTEKGAEVVTIGLGSWNRARDFAEERDIPFPLLADPRKESYKAMGLERGSMGQLVGPRVWKQGAKNILGGTPTTITKLDMKQLGGSAVILPGGAFAFLHRATTSADNAPIDELLAAIP